MTDYKRAVLILQDGTRFEGKSFGYQCASSGEVVFNTAMTGYPESLTDPSYEGQILVCTFPLSGNYGVPPHDNGDGLPSHFEGRRIHCRGLIVQDYSWQHSHWLADTSLSEWLKSEKIPAIFDIDTRSLTKHLRNSGSLLGKIIIEGSEDVDFYDPNTENLVGKTSCTSIEEYGNPNGKKVILVDCGVKNNIIRCLASRGVHVIRVPWDYDYTNDEFDGVFVSNGPGNPEFAQKTADILRRAMEIGKPICGICMGNQLLARAAGARTFKLKYGHRSHNQPVRRVGTNTCFVTSQNHGFAVDNDSLPADWEPLFINMNDGTNEGIRHKTKPFFSAQFHPEASSGPRDTEFIFDEFIALL